MRDRFVPSHPSKLPLLAKCFFHLQGDEVEATRHWRHALEQIYEHRATKAIPGYGPQTDTEKALVEALKQLELQCKERIDLLEALRASRQEGTSSPPIIANASKAPNRDGRNEDNRLKGSIGQGTIPAVTYSQLSRPTPLKRPSLPSRPLSGPAASSTLSPNHHDNASGGNNGNKHRSQSPNLPLRPDKTLRSPSPEKHTMRTTLRSGKVNDKQSKPARKSPKPAAEGPSKAATLAWSALGSRDRLWKAPSPEGGSSISSLPTRHSSEQARISSSSLQWDSHSRRLVTPRDGDDVANGGVSQLSVSAASSALNLSSAQDATELPVNKSEQFLSARMGANFASSSTFTREETEPGPSPADKAEDSHVRKDLPSLHLRREAIARRPVPSSLPPSKTSKELRVSGFTQKDHQKRSPREKVSSESDDPATRLYTKGRRVKARERAMVLSEQNGSSDEMSSETNLVDDHWKSKKASILTNLPPGVDESAAKQILNDIVVQGDEVHWGDIAGLEIAKNALRETVVYPFLRPDLFMGLREPARGMLLFGPPGTGKTMLARAVATESKSTFFSISASSLTSKYLGESEKLVRALFALARSLAPSIIFVDEIDSLLSQRSGSGEHEATRRIKTEFLIQWSDLQRAAAGREATERDKERGDANRVLVLAATNLPWAIDEAARRRFVRRQYIPLPEPHTRETQLRTLLGQQKHELSDSDIERLVSLTDGKSSCRAAARATQARVRGTAKSLTSLPIMRLGNKTNTI